MILYRPDPLPNERVWLRQTNLHLCRACLAQEKYKLQRPYAGEAVCQQAVISVNRLYIQNGLSAAGQVSSLLCSYSCIVYFPDPSPF